VCLLLRVLLRFHLPLFVRLQLEKRRLPGRSLQELFLPPADRGHYSSWMHALRLCPRIPASPNKLLVHSLFFPGQHHGKSLSAGL
jgi:hypothetical protein